VKYLCLVYDDEKTLRRCGCRRGGAVLLAAHQERRPDAGGRGDIEGPRGHAASAAHGDLPARERALRLPGAPRAAHLGIADLPTEGPETPEALAAKMGTHARSLRRVLRLLASAGVFTEDADGRLELTPVGSTLRSGPGSSRAAARRIAGPMVWQCGGDLLTTVGTGEAAFPRIFKTGSFEHFPTIPMKPPWSTRRRARSPP
jgi:hypothetical protein